MVYFVYYDGGSCNEGDHICGLEEFADLAAAEARAAELLADVLREPVVSLIAGRELPLPAHNARNPRDS